MKREFLQLAHVYKDGKYGIASWFASEKLDGQRAFWDGGLTRGTYADQVPFANVEKDGRYLSRPRSTGLWSRYGKTIQAPNWWLNQLPMYPLDGELYMGRGMFQSLMSTVKDLRPGPDWQQVYYMAFDAPRYDVVLGDGELKDPRFKKRFSGVMLGLPPPQFPDGPYTRNFEQTLSHLRSLPQTEVFRVHDQEQLPCSTAAAIARMEAKFREVVDGGGEGLILRHPSSHWTPARVRTCLKFKPDNDAEGRVIGYTWGRETDNGSKLLGMMGALVLDFRGKRLELSGFTEQEREMAVIPTGTLYQEHYSAAATIGKLHPGEQCDDRVFNPKFPMGTTVTFKYRELSDVGIPKEARYHRKAVTL